MNRDESIKRIKEALRRRSGRAWSVTHDRGTASQWIDIKGMPKSRDEFGRMTEADAAELGALLGLPPSRDGYQVAASYEHRTEYVERAETGTASAIAAPYWD